MTGCTPADSRFCHEWLCVVGEGEPTPNVFPGSERNERIHGHATFADVHAMAENFRHALSQDGDGNSDRVTEIAPPFPQYQSVSGLESAADGQRRERSFEDET